MRKCFPFEKIGLDLGSIDFCDFLLFQVVHNTAVPNALAVDWIGKNLYWSDTEKRIIEVSKVNGLYPTVLVSKRVKFPRDLSLDPQAGDEATDQR